MSRNLISVLMLSYLHNPLLLRTVSLVCHHLPQEGKFCSKYACRVSCTGVTFPRLGTPVVADPYRVLSGIVIREQPGGRPACLAAVPPTSPL
jgi:hypothetical protein